MDQIPPTSAPALRVLVLDMLPSLTALLPPGAVLTEAESDDLTATLLATLRPDRVLLPLMGRGHDAMQVIERLEALGYTGAITVLAPTLPHPRMVERELRSIGPGDRLILLTP